MSKKQLIIAKTIAWLLCLMPLLRLVYRGVNAVRHVEPDLGANPIEFITLSTGTWTLVFILITLSITPLRKVTGIAWLIKFRRLIGLFAYFYSCLHFTTYIWLDKFFNVPDMLHDVAKRPFITAGFLAFVLMLPLAATSTNWSIRKLGGKRWNLLHKLIYVTGISGVVHFWWKVKPGVRDHYPYAAVLAVLLLYRIFVRVRPKLAGSAGKSTESSPALN